MRQVARFYLGNSAQRKSAHVLMQNRAQARILLEYANLPLLKSATHYPMLFYRCPDIGGALIFSEIAQPKNTSEDKLELRRYSWKFHQTVVSTVRDPQLVFRANC